MSGYLLASELADLVGCKINQHAVMKRWLNDRRWKYVLDRNGLPKVARAYHDKKLGIGDDGNAGNFAAVPNLEVRARKAAK